MWLFLPIGAFSIVLTKDNSGKLQIRSRIKHDLERLKQFLVCSDIVESKNTDYPYRVFSLKSDFQICMEKMIRNITYSNFKNEVYKVDGPEREHLYHDVWHVMHNAEAKLERAKQKKEDPGMFPSPFSIRLLDEEEELRDYERLLEEGNLE